MAYDNYLFKEISNSFREISNSSFRIVASAKSGHLARSHCVIVGKKGSEEKRQRVEEQREMAETYSRGRARALQETLNAPTNNFHVRHEAAVNFSGWRMGS